MTLTRLTAFALPSFQFCGLLAVLLALFLMGGSSRFDFQSLAILNPITVFCSGVALLTFRQEHWNDKKVWIVGFALLFLLVAFYLVPFPTGLGGISSERVSLAVLRDKANSPNTSTVLSIMPSATWQSLFSLFAPLAVFLLGMQLARDELTQTLPVVILIGAVSGVIGVLQLAGSPDGPLYLYRVTNNGAAVGLFANRNHAAVLLGCMFPLLAVFATGSHGTRSRGSQMQRLTAIAVAMLIVPLILVTGSRAGLLAGSVGMIGGVLLYRSQLSSNNLQKKDPSWTYIVAASVMLCLVFATIYFSRAEAIDRLFVDENTANSRADFWAYSLNLFWKYFPFGFGPGSFVPAFLNEEPIAMLSSRYLNTAHNDWFETGLTFGVPGILLMLSGVVYYVRRSFHLWFRMDGRRSTVALGRMASIIIAMLGIASMSDYPLRTPALMGFAALVLLWFTEASREPKVSANNSA
jgi:O-antigen ligase